MADANMDGSGDTRTNDNPPVFDGPTGPDGDTGPDVFNGGPEQGPPPVNNGPPLHWDRVKEVVITRKVDAALWATRLITIILTFLYVVPILGTPFSFYYKAFLASAATSALRLHQRIPRVTLSRAFFSTLLIEDSCHYLFYSLIFVYCSPITLALFPVLLFAVLHFASFSLVLLDALGRNTGWLARVFISLIEFQTVTILRMAAGAEIFTMLFAVMYALMGRASLVTPFVYFRFLTLRYASRRNHYTRTMFYEIRMTADKIANSTMCPSFLATAIRRVIELISRLSPVTTAPAE